eukprot:132245_1
MTERTVCIEIDIFGILLLVISVIPILFSFIISFCGFIESLKLTNATLRYLYWTSSITLLIAAISFPIHQMYSWEPYCLQIRGIIITGNIALGSYMISLICICCLYLYRINTSFKNSLYSISNCIFCLFLFGLLLQFILVILALYFNESAWSEGSKNINSKEYIFALNGLFLSLLIFGILNILYNILLLIVYLSKIYQITTNMNTQKNAQNIVESVIKPSTVYMLCLCMAFCTTTITFIIGWIRTHPSLDINEMYLCHMVLFAWDIFINLLSINLQFPVAKYIFNKCCKHCQRWLVRLFVNKMKIIPKNENIQLVPSVTTNATSNDGMTGSSSSSGKFNLA